MWHLEKESEIRAWIAPIIMSVADTAVDRQQGRNRDFARYAAQAAACKRAYLELKCLGEHAPDIRFHHTAVDNLRDAFEEAHRELEYVVTMLPYSPLSEKYRCSCGLSLVYCTCMYRCKCDEWISRWPWQLQDLEDACNAHLADCRLCATGSGLCGTSWSPNTASAVWRNQHSALKRRENSSPRGAYGGATSAHKRECACCIRPVSQKTTPRAPCEGLAPPLGTTRWWAGLGESGDGQRWAVCVGGGALARFGLCRVVGISPGVEGRAVSGESNDSRQ